MSPRVLVCAAIVAGLSLCASAQGRLRVALTFDDLPAHGPLAPGQTRPQVVTSILATLKQEHMPPSYGFINSFRMEEYPYQIHILKAWHDAGQPLGNHSYSHEELDTMTAEAFTRDIAANEAVLKQLDPNGDWHWFRYPYMEEGETAAKHAAVQKWLHENAYKIAEVSLNFQDYKWNDAYGRCNLKHDKAAIVTLHDTYLSALDQSITGTRKFTHAIYGRDIAYVLLLHVGSFDAKMLPELIALFRARGFEFSTLQEAEADPVYEVEQGGPAGAPGIKGGGEFQQMVALMKDIDVPSGLAIFDEVDKLCK